MRKERNFFVTMTNIVCVAVALMTTVSCTVEEEEEIVVKTTKGITIEVTDEVAESATRAGYTGFPATTFEEGDEIGVYAFNGSSYICSNVKFTREADGSWTPAAEVVYNPDYTYYAYFPYRSTTYTPSTSGTVDDVDTKFANFITDSSGYFWKADQSTKNNFTYSNLMIAKGVVTGSKTVRFTLEHKRGLAVIGPSTNKWYYTDATGTKYSASLVYTTNIPYQIGDNRYFLMRPNTSTSVGGLTLSASAGKYKYMVGGELIGTPTFTYATSYNQGSSFGSYSSTKPSWLTVDIIDNEGEPTEFAITVTNSTSTSTTNKGTVSSKTADSERTATLRAATVAEDVDLSMVDNTGAARASRTTANCYLVHAAGTYKIPLVYGNAIKNGATYSLAYLSNTSTNSYKLQNLVNHAGTAINNPWIKTVIGSAPDGAKLIWEEVQGMISSVGIDGDYLTFTVDADKIEEGNAVIAATLDGTVVWSWHIWVTTETLETLTSIATGNHTYQVAPVNVGQTNTAVINNATLYAGEHCSIKAVLNGVTIEFKVIADDYYYGGTKCYNPSPYYQWGRKDPERPITGAYNDEGTYAQNPTYVSSGVTIGTTIQNPDNHYYSSYGPYNEYKYNYWDINQTGTQNISTKTYKTVYDPCPPGFCVPTGNLYYYMGNTGGSNSSYGSWSSTTLGRTWIYNSANLYFPASGYRYSSSGSLNSVGGNGYYWSASAYGTDNGSLLGFHSGSWYWGNYGRSNGYPVRAVAEE